MKYDPVGPFGLIVLAGGASERMGAPKGLLPVRGMPLVDWQLGRFWSAGGVHAVVVLGYDAEAYRKALPALPAVVNPTPELGPFSSLAAGLGWWRGYDFRGAFVLPVDVPAPDADTWRLLAEAVLDGAVVARPVHAGKRGHPIALSPAFCRDLAARDVRTTRLDEAIRALPANQVLDVAVADANVTLNLNDPAAFAAWTRDEQF